MKSSGTTITFFLFTFETFSLYVYCSLGNSGCKKNWLLQKIFFQVLNQVNRMSVTWQMILICSCAFRPLRSINVSIDDFNDTFFFHTNGKAKLMKLGPLLIGRVSYWCQQVRSPVSLLYSYLVSFN